MTNPLGSFIWYELMTTDPEGAAAFYGAVVGWTISAQSGPASTSGGVDYRPIGRSDGGMAGGVLKLTDQMCAGGARPCWLGYIHTPDVDAAVAAILADGGTQMIEPFDMEVGRIAMVTDPQGAPFYVMSPVPPPGREGMASDVFSVDQPQRVRWNELSTSDPEAAVKFYATHFGWTQEGDMDMGDLGKYRFIQHHGTGIGAIMPKMPAMPVSVWTYYIGVDDIDRAVAAIGEGGGTVTVGPMEIPGGEYALNGIDPQGAAFGLVGPKRA